MAKKPSSVGKPAAAEAEILSYRHADRRKNNPEVGMVTPATDADDSKAVWQHDPHLDPSLSWTGKAERLSFEVDTVSLHVHERIDPASILSAVRKRVGAGETAKDKAKGAKAAQMKAIQPGLFDAPFESLPLRDAIDFYKHDKGWSNRLVAGDSLLVMNSLLQKEGMAGSLQMMYFDPPYGIKYGSNFQPFVNKRDVKDRADADLTQEPEMIKAFRDTWELGIHSYLTYLRDRLLLAKELLSETGSVFVQISDENLHHVREIMDEVFGAGNFCSVITVVKTASQTAELIAGVSDYLVWYAKDKGKVKYRKVLIEKQLDVERAATYKWVQNNDLSSRSVTTEDFNDSTANVFCVDNLTSQRPPGDFPVEFRGQTFAPGRGYWKTGQDGMPRLARANRLAVSGSTLRYRRFLRDFAAQEVGNLWSDTGTGSFTDSKVYVVQTGVKVAQRCLLMTTDPGDLVFDPTCGSGTTAFVAEKWGRRWITCDTSRVAVTLAKQRLMTASYDYYELRYPHEGLRGGFIWKTVPHVMLKSIANNPEIDEIYQRMHPAIEAALADLNRALKADAKEWEVPFDFPGGNEKARAAFDAFHAARQSMQRQMDRSIADHADQETLYDQPAKSKSKLRITGPFSVEAVPFPTVAALDETRPPQEADASIARSGESSRQHQWRDELLKTGIRGKGGQMLKFAELETQPGTRYLHATGHLESGERVVVSFGPEYAALEQRQVTLALTEAGELFPLPKMIVFCAFTFDPEAAKDIDHMKGIVALKAQMNTDLLTEDLKKARASNQSFWLMGQPDVEVRKLKNGDFEVEVHGFDYFDTVQGELVSGGKGRIAMWSLDTDYDERSLFPHQVFFPMAGKGEGWDKLKKDIRAELDEDLLPQFHGTVSLPFAAGDNRKVAVKIVDDRGIESLKIVNLDE
ncbi:MAG: site-specific DNA-methyltransferase [Sulfuritalea sp.]|jgi:adenine-specific DNA-methyltransferase|nr:site-specific DNA-methyltransferase [Sulfuritalea sp.]MDP1982268.1 site-specific DNA-methyltransferase [Sulfuritalea sp.]